MGSFFEQEHLRSSSFQPYQIVCLEHEASCLYAEVVQIVESRQICWVRPLVLSLLPLGGQNSDEETSPLYYDLRSGSDLLYPLSLFRLALDTEVLPLLSFLYTSDTTRRDNNQIKQAVHEHFKQFIQKIWQAYPEAF